MVDPGAPGRCPIRILGYCLLPNHWSRRAGMLWPAWDGALTAFLRWLTHTPTPQDKTMLQTRIDATDRQIDRLDYELYGLRADEIKIVEEGTGK